MVAVQKRLGATSKMLSSLKAMKMLRFDQHLSSTLQKLRNEEIMAAKAFRTILVVSVFLCMFPIEFP